MSKIFSLLGILGLLFSLCTLVNSECNDIEPNACGILKTLLPDICKDSCVADVCRRTCDNCPIRCYHCDKTFYPEECNKKKECNDSQVCVAAQELSVDFLPIYVSDCMEIQTCLNIFGEINTGISGPPKMKRANNGGYSLNGSCCDNDFCNFHDPSFTPSELPSVIAKPKPTAVDYGNACDSVDVDVDLCRNFTMLDKTICDKPCFAQKICPQTCQTCRTCYRCPDVKDTSDCQTTDICNLNQRCIQIHTLDDNFVPEYKLGCASNEICRIYFGSSNAAPQLVGKRQISREGKCCDTDYCNGPAPPTTVSTTSTSASPKPSPSGSNVTQVVDTTTNMMSKQTTNVGYNTTTEMMTTVITTNVPLVTTPGPDTRCQDVSTSCVYHQVFCNSSDLSSVEYAAKNCPSTCQLCDKYWEIQNNTQSVSTTTPIPCIDNLPGCSTYGPLFCQDTSQNTRDFVIKFCAQTCNLCAEYFKYKGYGS